MKVSLLEFSPSRIELGISETKLGLPNFVFTPEAGKKFSVELAEQRAAYAALALAAPFAVYTGEEFVLDIPFPRKDAPAAVAYAHNLAAALGRYLDDSITFPNLTDWEPDKWTTGGRYVLPVSSGIDSTYALAHALNEGIKPLALTVNMPLHPLPGETEEVTEFLGIHFPAARVDGMPEMIGDVPFTSFWNLLWFYSYWVGVSALMIPPPAGILWSTCFWYAWPDDVRLYYDLPSGSPAIFSSLSMMGYYPIYVHSDMNRGQRVRGIREMRPEWMPNMGSCWGPGVYGPGKNCGLCEKCAVNLAAMIAYGVSPSEWPWLNDWRCNPYLLGTAPVDHMSAYYLPFYAEKAHAHGAFYDYGDYADYADAMEMMLKWLPN